MSEGSQYLVLQTTRERMPWHRQYRVLLNRGIREQIRKKNVVITQLIQSMMCALLIGGVFFQIGNGQKSTVRRQPVLFFCVINQGVFGALTVINSFPGERVLTLRERAAGMYYCSSYFMAKVSYFHYYDFIQHSRVNILEQTKLLPLLKRNHGPVKSGNEVYLAFVRDIFLSLTNLFPTRIYWNQFSEGKPQPLV